MYFNIGGLTPKKALLILKTKTSILRINKISELLYVVSEGDEYKLNPYNFRMPYSILQLNNWICSKLNFRNKVAKSIKPQFLKFFIPIVDSLKILGGSGTSSEVIDLAIDKLKISEEEQQETIKNGESKIRNQAQWARLYLVKGGYISSLKGVCGH